MTSMEHSFEAMGTSMSVQVYAGPGRTDRESPVDGVAALFSENERRFSRFAGSSELSRLNVDRHLPEPSKEMWEVLQKSLRWWRETGGLFEPAILPNLERLGYPSYAESPGCAGDHHLPGAHGSTGPVPPSSLADLRLSWDGSRRTVTLENSTRIDLGGIVKGWTVDLAMSRFRHVEGLLVDAGGDIRVRGASPESSEGWWVSVEDPLSPERDCGYLLLSNGAIATSGKYRRRWSTDTGGAANHLVDPRTGGSSDSDAVACSVVAPTAEEAEIHAKVAVMLGMSAGREYLVGVGRDRCEGILFGLEGDRLGTPGWRWLEA